MAVYFGIQGLVAEVGAVILGFLRGGEVPLSYALGVFLSLLFSMLGLWLAWRGRTDEDSFSVFPNIGIGLNLLALALGGGLVLLGLH